MPFIRRGQCPREYYEKYTRNVRFNLYRSFNCPIVLGHIKDDLIENIWSNIARGSDLFKLHKMDERDVIDGVTIIRPFIRVLKEDIYEFAYSHRIPYLKNTTPEWSNRGKMRNTFIPAAKEQFGSSIDDKLLYMSDSLVSYNKLLVDKVFKPFYESVISLNLGLKVNIGDFVDMDIHFWQNILTTLFHSIDVCKPSIKSVTNFTEALKRRKKGAINLTITTYCYIDKNNDLYILKTDKLLEVLGVMSLKKRGWSNIKGILTPCIDRLV